MYLLSISVFPHLFNMYSVVANCKRLNCKRSTDSARSKGEHFVPFSLPAFVLTLFIGKNLETWYKQFSSHPLKNALKGK